MRMPVHVSFLGVFEQLFRGLRSTWTAGSAQYGISARTLKLVHNGQAFLIAISEFSR